MVKLLTALAAGLVLASAPASARPADPEAKLAKLLEGRVAGEPQRCIQLRNIRSSQIIDRTAIVYEVGNTLYVNRPEGGARGLDDWNILVTDTRTPELCNIDIVRLVDRSTHFPNGFVNLGDFVPYRKPRPATAE